MRSMVATTGNQKLSEELKSCVESFESDVKIKTELFEKDDQENRVRIYNNHKNTDWLKSVFGVSIAFPAGRHLLISIE